MKIRDFTVPSGIASTSAISAYERPQHVVEQHCGAIRLVDPRKGILQRASTARASAILFAGVGRLRDLVEGRGWSGGRSATGGRAPH